MHSTLTQIRIQRSATSAFDVDLSSQNKYAVEFDLALTKSSKDDVQFVVASGTMPTANTGMTSNYIFKINMAGNSNNCKINDVDAATVTLLQTQLGTTIQYWLTRTKAWQLSISQIRAVKRL